MFVKKHNVANVILMGEIHQRHVRYDDSGKQSGGGPASISQIYLGSDVLRRRSDLDVHIIID